MRLASVVRLSAKQQLSAKRDCTGGETCLPSGFIDTVQTTDGADPAEQATGYLAKTTTARATQLKVSSVSLLPLVASAPVRAAWCGNSVDYCGDTETVDGVIACYQNGVGRCSLDFGHDICADVVSTVEGEDGALNYCLDLAGTDEGLCLGICDGRVLGDGTGPDLNCGEGAECLAINEPFFGIPARSAEGSDEPAPCGEGDTCEEGETCTDFNGQATKGCYIHEKFCRTIASTGAEQHVDRQFEKPRLGRGFFLLMRAFPRKIGKPRLGGLSLIGLLLEDANTNLGDLFNTQS